MLRWVMALACMPTPRLVRPSIKHGPNYPNGGEWVANTPGNIEGANLLWQHHNWDVGLVYKRVGQYYNDNGSLDLHDRRRSRSRTRWIRRLRFNPGIW